MSKLLACRKRPTNRGHYQTITIDSIAVHYSPKPKPFHCIAHCLSLMQSEKPSLKYKRTSMFWVQPKKCHFLINGYGIHSICCRQISSLRLHFKVWFACILFFLSSCFAVQNFFKTPNGTKI